MRTNTYPSKYAQPKGIFTIGKTKFKWYDLASDPSEVSRQDIDNAQLCIENAEENFKNIDDLGFVIMHRCGENYLLLVCTWRSENELWESVYYDGPENLKYGKETKPIFQLTVSGKWALYIMNLSPGKNIWVPDGKKKTKRTISMISLREKCRNFLFCH